MRQSGKNSADIRMVVDALDLCYTKEHVDTFVIISGDSDFSPLVSKLRENNKIVIGVGVKNSTSDLLIANCDEFIYYDDLVRRQPPRAPRPRRRARPQAGAKPGGEGRQAPAGDKKQEALDLIVETYEALVEERGEGEKIWGSMIKQTLKRRKPGFNESYYGFRILRPAAGGGGSARAPGAGARREVRRLHHQELPRRLSRGQFIVGIAHSAAIPLPPMVMTPSIPHIFMNVKKHTEFKAFEE